MTAPPRPFWPEDPYGYQLKIVNKFGGYDLAALVARSLASIGRAATLRLQYLTAPAARYAAAWLLAVARLATVLGPPPPLQAAPSPGRTVIPARVAVPWSAPAGADFMMTGPPRAATAPEAPAMIGP